MIMNIILSIVGFILLIKCAEIFVDGASSFAKNLKVPATVIGLTIVAFGTSAPELAVSISSHLANNTDMIFGNVIGSNIINILLILGLAGFFRTLKVNENVIKKELPLLLFITLGVSVLFLDTLFEAGLKSNSLNIADGIILMLFFCIFIYYLITLLLKNKNQAKDEENPKYKMLMSIIATIIGLGGIIFGSNLVVNNVSAFAIELGISQKIISMTVIALGTSLPELITTIVAVKKGEVTLAIGNVIGSNIFNICIVLGLPIVLLGSITPLEFNIVDIVVMILSVILLWLVSITKNEIKKSEAFIFLIAFFTYYVYLFF